MTTVTTLNETIETSRITILIPDGAIYLDQGVTLGQDFSNCDIPDNIHCFHIMDGEGEIQYKDDRQNLPITEIPQWVLNCVRLWYR